MIPRLLLPFSVIERIFRPHFLPRFFPMFFPSPVFKGGLDGLHRMGTKYETHEYRQQPVFANLMTRDCPWMRHWLPQKSSAKKLESGRDRKLTFSVISFSLALHLKETFHTIWRKTSVSVDNSQFQHTKQAENSSLFQIKLCAKKCNEWICPSETDSVKKDFKTFLRLWAIKVRFESKFEGQLFENPVLCELFLLKFAYNATGWDDTWKSAIFA